MDKRHSFNDLTILTNGKRLSIPMVAANAVFPLQARKKSDTVKVLLRLKIENFHDWVGWHEEV
jgi:hypothetical protein